MSHPTIPKYSTDPHFFGPVRLRRPTLGLCGFGDLAPGFYNLSIAWVVPLQSDSHHQDHHILVGDPYKPSFATVTGKGDNPEYYTKIYGTNENGCSWADLYGDLLGITFLLSKYECTSRNVELEWMSIMFGKGDNFMPTDNHNWERDPPWIKHNVSLKLRTRKYLGFQGLWPFIWGRNTRQKHNDFSKLKLYDQVSNKSLDLGIMQLQKEQTIINLMSPPINPPS